MVDFTDSFENVNSDLLDIEIDCNIPGFYDHPNFIEEETRFPEFLNNYARFVQTQAYDNDYLERSRREIPVIANALHDELLRDGRQGACVDMSGVFSRILEREGLWNFVVKGSLTVSFPENSGIGNRYFWSVDNGEFVAGHAWLFAPPFSVVDLTLKQQQRDQQELQYFPDHLLAEGASVGNAETRDIVSPKIIRALIRQGVQEEDFLSTINPTMEKFVNTFETYFIESENTTFKYVPVATTAPDCPLEEMFGISENGRSAIDIYNESVVPALNAIRA